MVGRGIGCSPTGCAAGLGRSPSARGILGAVSERSPLSTAEVDAFRREGFLRLRQVIDADLLGQLRRDTEELIDAAHPQPDYEYGDGPGSRTPVLRRVEYVVDKLPSCRRLLAHPTLLALVEQLQGPDTIPTWDSMVVKMPGDGVVVPWHRDDSEHKVVDDVPIFNIDVYLDDTDDHTALWALPCSHAWSDHDAWTEAFRRMEHDAFLSEGARRIPMRAGDVLLHDIRLVHGSPPSEGGALRRVVYLEFRPVATERAVGPHDERYVERKRAVLAACTRNTPTEPGELRVPHDEYWRG
jgi:hypothetical protein